MSNSEKNLLPPLWHRKWYIMIVGINSRRLWQPCWKFMKRYGFVKYRLFAQNLVFAWLLKTKPDLTLVGRRLAMRLLRHLLACNHIIHIIRIKCKKTYQFTTPCKSDEVTHPKQHKSFFSGIMWSMFFNINERTYYCQIEYSNGTDTLLHIERVFSSLTK